MEFPRTLGKQSRGCQQHPGLISEVCTGAGGPVGDQPHGLPPLVTVFLSSQHAHHPGLWPQPHFRECPSVWELARQCRRKWAPGTRGCRAGRLQRILGRTHHSWQNLSRQVCSQKPPVSGGKDSTLSQEMGWEPGTCEYPPGVGLQECWGLGEAAWGHPPLLGPPSPGTDPWKQGVGEGTPPHCVAALPGNVLALAPWSGTLGTCTGRHPVCAPGPQPPTSSSRWPQLARAVARCWSHLLTAPVAEFYLPLEVSRAVLDWAGYGRGCRPTVSLRAAAEVTGTRQGAAGALRSVGGEGGVGWRHGCMRGHRTRQGGAWGVWEWFGVWGRGSEERLACHGPVLTVAGGRTAWQAASLASDL
ncbi:uncharacterized protein LOC116418628 [Piliocolobus tephrosceles]|uniref:uncharacterized protein LOC116418628 n=1 Tax=Piliocolobus tephrosceles TaxID=591936 RepID=UPI0013011180|nr:uncharacterized protein LOC116418628 [Piliocolobus tephrosceles]